MRNVYLAASVVALLAASACGGQGDSGAAAPSNAKAASLSSTSPIDLAYSVKGASELDVDAFLTAILDDDKPSYKNAFFDQKTGATVVEGLRFADMEDGEGFTIARAEIYGADAEAVKAVNNAEGAVDAPFVSLFEKVRLFDIAAIGVEDDGAALSVGAIEFDSLSARPGGANANPEGAGAANFFNAFTLGGLYFKDINIGGEQKDVQSAVVEIPDLRIVGLGGGKLEKIIAKDARFDISRGDSAAAALSALGPQAAAIATGPFSSIIAPSAQGGSFETLEWSNIDFSGLLPYGLKGETPPSTARDLIDLGEMEARNVVTTINGKTLSASDKMTLSKAEFAWIIPSDIRFDFTGAKYDFTAYAPDTEAPAYSVIADNGLDDVSGDGSVEWTWNPAKGEARFAQDFNGKGFGDFDINVDFSGVPLAAIEQAEGASDAPIAEAWAQTAALNGFSMTLRDEKILDTVFGLSAIQMGGTAEDLRQSAPALIRLSGAAVTQQLPSAAPFLNAFADFISSGGALEIKAQPETPALISTLQGPGVEPDALVNVLNITVEQVD